MAENDYMYEPARRSSGGFGNSGYKAAHCDHEPIHNDSDEKEKEKTGGVCWNTSCSEWATCNGHGCPGGNWHDI